MGWLESRSDFTNFGAKLQQSCQSPSRLRCLFMAHVLGSTSKESKRGWLGRKPTVEQNWLVGHNHLRPTCQDSARRTGGCTFFPDRVLGSMLHCFLPGSSSTSSNVIKLDFVKAGAPANEAWRRDRWNGVKAGLATNRLRKMRWETANLVSRYGATNCHLALQAWLMRVALHMRHQEHQEQEPATSK